MEASLSRYQEYIKPRYERDPQFKKEYLEKRKKHDRSYNERTNPKYIPRVPRLQSIKINDDVAIVLTF